MADEMIRITSKILVVQEGNTEWTAVYKGDEYHSTVMLELRLSLSDKEQEKS